MVRTSRESFLKVQEVESDLDAISLIGETGMSSAQVRNAVVKMGGVTSSAAQIDAGIAIAVYAESFGAKGDGVTDDTIPIQNAINYAFDNNLGEVRFKSGKFLISQSLVLKSGVSIVGIRPKLTFLLNCPDLGFTMDSGTVFLASSSTFTGIVGNHIDSIGVDSGIKALSNVKLKDIGLKGFKKGIKIGAINQLGLGMGGFEGVIIDGTDSNNIPVGEVGIELWNIQQTTNDGIYIYNTRNGLKIYNDKDTPICSSGNSLFLKTYVFLNTDSRSEFSSSVSSITLGATTTISFSVAHSFVPGDIVQLNGFSGTDGSILNNIFTVYSVVNSTTIIVKVQTTGKTIVSTGATLEKGRAGIHLVSRGTMDLNHVVFEAPQVNAFMGGTPYKGVCNIALCGTTSYNTGISFIQCDIEGYTDSHLFIEGTSTGEFHAVVVSQVPPLGNFNIKNSNSLTIRSSDPDATINMAHKSASQNVYGIKIEGTFAGYTSNSTKAISGKYFDSANFKTLFGGTSGNNSLVIDHSTPSVGIDDSNNTWGALRLFARYNGFKYSGDASIGIDRCGLIECNSSSDRTITLPTSGSGYYQAKTGTPILISKISGVGKVTITPQSGQTIAGSTSSFVLYGNTGASILLVSSGEGDWVIISVNQNGSLLTSGTTAQRPTPQNIGFNYFDTTINIPLFYKGSGVWVDGAGTVR